MVSPDLLLSTFLGLSGRKLPSDITVALASGVTAARTLGCPSDETPVCVQHSILVVTFVCRTLPGCLQVRSSTLCPYLGPPYKGYRFKHLDCGSRVRENLNSQAAPLLEGRESANLRWKGTLSPGRLRVSICHS